MTITSDPIDVIALGRRIIDVACEVDGFPLGDWDSMPCDFVDCYEDVYLTPDEHDAAFCAYMHHGHDDDQILFCCRDHIDHINNAPALIGPDAIDAYLRSEAERMFG